MEKGSSGPVAFHVWCLHYGHVHQQGHVGVHVIRCDVGPSSEEGWFLLTMLVGVQVGESVQMFHQIQHEEQLEKAERCEELLEVVPGRPTWQLHTWYSLWSELLGVAVRPTVRVGVAPRRENRMK